MTKTKRVLPSRGPGRPAGTDKSGAHTREHLLETARSLLAEKGLGQLSLREIADRAQVNPALLHYYFGSKDDLRAALQDSSFKHLVEKLTAISTDGKPHERMAQAITGLVDAMFEDPTLHRLVLQHALGGEASEKERFDEDFIKPIHDFLLKIVRDSAKVANLGTVDMELAVASLLGAITMTVLFEIRSGQSRKKHVTEHVLRMISQSIKPALRRRIMGTSRDIIKKRLEITRPSGV